jgi:hypothetical protein
MSSAIHTALQAALAAAAATYEYLLYKRVTTNDRSQVSDMTAIGFYQTSTLRIYSFHSRSFIIGYYLSVGFGWFYKTQQKVEVRVRERAILFFIKNDILIYQRKYF